LQYDAGSNLWSDLVGYPSDYTILTFLLTNNVTKGTSYQFRIRARNIYGWSTLFSDPTTAIKASGIPAQMLIVTTSYDTLDDPTKVKLAWVEPYGNSEVILDY
jgi:hypothetical protein